MAGVILTGLRDPPPGGGVASRAAPENKKKFHTDPEILNSESGRFRISIRQNALWGPNSEFRARIQKFGPKFRISLRNSEFWVQNPEIQNSESARFRISIRHFALWGPNSEF